MSKNIPVLGAVTSILGGGSKSTSAAAPASTPAPEPAPTTAAVPSDAAEKKAQARRRSSLVAQGGRLSTILTADSDKLGA